jgi:hypothetical protein
MPRNLQRKAAREKTAEKASFAERGENLLTSGEQNQAPFGESGEKIAQNSFNNF